MPKEPKESKEPQAPKEPKAKKVKAEAKPEEGILATAAKAVGTAAGKIATLGKAVEPYTGPPRKSVKPARLEKKNNPHLPRKMKKEMKKKEMAKQLA